MRRSVALLVFLGLFAAPADAARIYNIGGAAGSLANRSGNWAWDGAYLADFRSALENPANFGDTGVVSNVEFQTHDLTTIDAASLAGMQGFVSSWWSDTQSAAHVSTVLDWFRDGGDLFLLQDDSRHDAIGAALGFSTSASDGSASNGIDRFFDGAFGVARDIVQGGNTGQIDGAAVLAAGGTIGATNESGQVTIAYWDDGVFAPGSGSLYIMADVDMWASAPRWASASYSPLNDNGIVGLNVLAELPEPGIALIAFGLLGVALRTRERASAAA